MPHPKAGYMDAIFFLSPTNFFLASRGEPYMTPDSCVRSCFYGSKPNFRWSPWSICCYYQRAKIHSAHYRNCLSFNASKVPLERTIL